MTPSISAPRALVLVLLGTMVVLSLLLTPLSVYAAGAVDAWYAVDVALYDLEPGLAPTLVITGLLKDDVELPAEVALSVPKGAAISWAGEVLGGDPSLDPMIAVNMESGKDYDIAHFTLEQSRRVQLELSVPEAFITDSPGSRQIDMVWMSAGKIDRARVSVSLPQTLHMSSAEPDPVVDYRPSDVLYSVETSPVVEGQVLEFHGTLAEGADPGLAEMMSESAEEATPAAPVDPIETQIETTTESGGLNNTWLIIGALLLVLVAVSAVLWRQLRR